MWERLLGQGPRTVALGTSQVQQSQAPPGRREGKPRCEMRFSRSEHPEAVGGRITSLPPLSGPQLQPLGLLRLPITCLSLLFHQPRVPPTAHPFLSSGVSQFLPHWGFKQAIPQEPMQHFLDPGHSASLMQAFGGFSMAHLIKTVGQEPGLVGFWALIGSCPFTGY